MSKIYWKILSNIILLYNTKWFHWWKRYIHTLIIRCLNRLSPRFTSSKILLLSLTIVSCVPFRRWYRSNTLCQLWVYRFYLFTQCDDVPQLLHHILLELFLLCAAIKLRGTMRLVRSFWVIITPHWGSLILVEHRTTTSLNLLPNLHIILGGSLW